MSDNLTQEPKPESTSTSLIELKAKAKKFRWTTFAFILLCFILPFVQVSCQQQKLMSFNGFQMAFGTEILEPQMFGPPKTRQIPGDGLILLSFLAALAGLGCSFIKGKLGSLVTAICGAIGFIFMLMFKVRLDNEVLKQAGGLLNVEYLFGFIVACFLFLVSAALNGYIFYGERADTTLPVAPTNTAEQLDRLKSSATGLAQQIRQWFIKKDVPGWVRSHVFLLGAIAGAVTVLLIVYYVFIKPSPSADGKRAALAYVNCQTAYKAKADSAYQSFLSEFTGQKYQTRADAERKLETLFAGERKVYNTCIDAADAKYNELAARYKDDSEGLATFSNAFTENNGESKPPDEIEQSSSSFANVNQKIQSIRAPFPHSSRIAKDLVGQSMDGWNFSYASEFKDVKIITQKPDGDMLILRTHLNLEDYVTKELYFTILDLKYSLNSNGEWDYAGFTQLLHDKADINYFIGNEIFLVGRWRWPSNYATYNADGTWFGKGDNGGDMSGNWRIVKGNLVLTFNGQNWFNKKIVQFSKNELIVDETNPTRAERIE
jgi:hypothetical protein